MKYQNPGCPNTMLVFKAVTKECLRAAYNKKKTLSTHYVSLQCGFHLVIVF